MGFSSYWHIFVRKVGRRNKDSQKQTRFFSRLFSAENVSFWKSLFEEAQLKLVGLTTHEQLDHFDHRSSLHTHLHLLSRKHKPEIRLTVD